ncbi:MAG: tRNA glutamyl-Q(34) synthetase GluQRS [Hyphomicrobiaceae bacterium]
MQPSGNQPVFRFAPSPTGLLHIGHALSALIGRLIADRFGGRFLLRIEDIDVVRCRPEFVAAIFEDLAWIGVTSQEPVIHQSQRLSHYASYRDRLHHAGLLYPCFATRSEIAEANARRGGGRDPDGVPLYPGLHKQLPATVVAQRMADGEPYALRLNMGKALEAVRRKLAGAALTMAVFDENGRRTGRTLDPARWGDVVIARKDTGTSYHLACVIDDADQGVTHVVRGKDLEAATEIHRVLQILLELPEPLYHHHPLMTDVGGRKLSKRSNDTSLRALRETGVSAAAIVKDLEPHLAPYQST